MSIQAVAWALEQDMPDSARKLVLISLANHADSSSGECWPWIGTIAREASVSPRTVHRKLPLLVSSGLIAMRERSGKATIYTVKFPRPTPDRMAGVAGLPRMMNRRDPCQDGRPTSATVGRQEPSFEPSYSQKKKTDGVSAAKPQGQPRKRTSERVEVIQHKIAERLGAHGWEILMRLPPVELDQLTAMQRAGTLTDWKLAQFQLHKAVQR